MERQERGRSVSSRVRPQRCRGGSGVVCAQPVGQLGSRVRPWRDPVSPSRHPRLPPPPLQALDGGSADAACGLPASRAVEPPRERRGGASTLVALCVLTMDGRWVSCVATGGGCSPASEREREPASGAGFLFKRARKADRTQTTPGDDTRAIHLGGWRRWSVASFACSMKRLPSNLCLGRFEHSTHVCSSSALGTTRQPHLVDSSWLARESSPTSGTVVAVSPHFLPLLLVAVAARVFLFRRFRVIG